MRYLFVASTPLQLYYASTIVLEKLNNNDTAELLLTDQFPEARLISSNLAKKAIFSELHYCEASFSLSSLRIMQLFAYFGKSYYHPDSLNNKIFDYFVISMPAAPNSSVFFFLKKKNPRIKVIFFEDGTGTYSGEVFKSPAYLGDIPDGIRNFSNRAKLYRSIFGKLPKAINSYNPSLLFVRQPQLVTYNCNFPIEKAVLTESNSEKVFSCFGRVNNANLIQSNSIIFIDPARTQTEAIKDFDIIDNLILSANRLGVSVFLREHPRTTIHSDYKDQCMDLSGGLWESFVRKANLDSCLLVGIGSTAQLASAMENQKKPFLLFLYKLFFHKNESIYYHYEMILSIAKMLYGSLSEKMIICPTSYEEAEHTIKSFINK